VPPRIVVLDGYTLNPGDNPWDDLGELGELEVHPRSHPDEVVARARGAEIAVINKVQLREGELAALPDLRFIAITATGYNVVDLAAARARRVLVANVPEYGTESVAQHTIALLLELASAVGEHAGAVVAGEWSASPDFCFWRRPLLELSGRTLGIVGFGRIGRRVGELAHAFGMRVIATRRGAASPPDYRPFEWRTVQELFAEADVVSLHCPLTDENERFVDHDLLHAMKRSALLLNTARGALIDERALAAALHDGVIAGAALDVVSREPIRPDNPLIGARNCIVTPHVAWATLAARRRLMQATVANVRAFLAGAPINLVG
jgi:glycerate dehydrogenase